MATASNIATIPDARASGQAVAPRKFAARCAIAGIAVAAAALFIPASLATWAANDHPRFAASIAPWNAEVASEAAAAIPGDPRRPEIRALVAKSLWRDAAQVEAIELRGLDLALSGKAAQARRLFQLSNDLSRRSLATRLWLIQDAVDRGDVAEALHNFDIALRTTTDAQPILFPVLTKASSDPRLTIALARTLDRPSDWRLMFVDWALSNAADVAPVARVVAHMRDDRFVVGNSLDQQLINRLVSSDEFEQAKILNHRFGRPAASVADPYFADLEAHYPFGWGLVSNGSIGAERALSGSTPVLTYRAAPANSGQVAAQLLTLQEGNYLLATRTAATPTGADPYWSLSCGELQNRALAQMDQPMKAGGRAEVAFTVPRGCSGQWLTLRLRPASDFSPQSGAIASVSVSAR